MLIIRSRSRARRVCLRSDLFLVRHHVGAGSTELLLGTQRRTIFTHTVSYCVCTRSLFRTHTCILISQVNGSKLATDYAAGNNICDPRCCCAKMVSQRKHVYEPRAAHRPSLLLCGTNAPTDTRDIGLFFFVFFLHSRSCALV